MPLGSTRDNYADVSRQLAEARSIIGQLIQRSDAQAAQISALKREREAAQATIKRMISDAQKASQARAPEVLESPDDFGAPILDVASWRRSQMGL